MIIIYDINWATCKIIDQSAVNNILLCSLFIVNALVIMSALIVAVYLHFCTFVTTLPQCVDCKRGQISKTRTPLIMCTEREVTK